MRGVLRCTCASRGARGLRSLSPRSDERRDDLVFGICEGPAATAAPATTAAAAAAAKSEDGFTSPVVWGGER